MIIGITGTNGAGKGTVVDYLVQKKGFTHYSVRDAITEEIIRRGLEVTRPNLNEVGTDLRAIHGPEYFPELFVSRAKDAGVENIIIESIRNPIEAESLKALGGIMLVVDADRRTRYERITARATETDKVTFEEFCAQEDREMNSEDPANPAKMSINAVIKIADYKIQNNRTIEELQAEIDSLPIFN